MQLPRVESLPLLVTKWASILNPLIASPLNNVSILKNIDLINGGNIIPHLLGRMQQGWWILDQDAEAEIFRYQPLNTKFLYLNASSIVTVSIGVF